MKKLLFIFPLIVAVNSSFTVFSPDMHRPGHIDDTGSGLVYFDNLGTTSSMLLIGNTEMPAVSEKIGFNIALIPFKDKYIPIAYDAVPFVDHENAEAYVMSYAKSQGLAELPVEQYSFETIKKAETYLVKDKQVSSIQKEKMLLIIEQTLAYMKTDYFKKIYLDGSRVRNPEEVSVWINENTVLDPEIAREELGKQPLLLKN